MKLNIGPGMHWHKPHWKTLDYQFFATFYQDLRKNQPLRIDNNRLTKVFSSHCIEHISDASVENLLNELFKYMEPGAILRLSCPDADKAIKAFKNRDHNWFNATLAKGNIGQQLVGIFYSSYPGLNMPEVTELEVEEKLNTLSKDDFIKWCYEIRPEGNYYIAHCNGFYYEKLEKILSKAGYVNIKRSGYLQSDDEEFRDPDFDKHEFMSLYVECYKP